MLTLLKHWWNAGEEIPQHDQKLELTVTRLMVSMMKMDDSLDQSQYDEIIRLVSNRFGITHADAGALFHEAMVTDGKGPRFEQLAKQIKSNYNRFDLAVLLNDIWRVAEANGQIDFYEDQFIGRISGLLGVSPEVLAEIKQHRKAA